MEIEERTAAGSFIYETPESIVRLAARILNPQAGMKVADVCSGTGTFIVESYSQNPSPEYIGYEIDSELCKEARKRFVEKDMESASMEEENVFALPNDQSKRFDRIFSNYPFRTAIRDISTGSEYLEQIKQKIPEISKATSSDWIFNALVCDLLKPDGKAVAIMSNGSALNRIDSFVRKHFIENGLVEAVISLPGRMFDSTAIPTSLIVLSRGNTKVHLIDATEMYVRGRRQNILSDEHIERILEMLRNDTPLSRSFDFSTLAQNEYGLTFQLYNRKEQEFENEVMFGSIIRNVTRGTSIKANELDELTTEEKTDFNYLMMGNIREGIIDTNLPYLKSMEPRLEKYCLKSRDMVLSKNGAPFKIAIAEPREGQQILANGNMFIIQFDETKANPYYIKSYFESERGKKSLKSISAGSSIPNISLESLKNLMIPLADMETQNRFEEEHIKIQEEIRETEKRLAAAIKRKNGLFDTLMK